jgi:hypothetical protein
MAEVVQTSGSLVVVPKLAGGLIGKINEEAAAAACMESDTVEPLYKNTPYKNNLCIRRRGRGPDGFCMGNKNIFYIRIFYKKCG